MHIKQMDEIEQWRLLSEANKKMNTGVYELKDILKNYCNVDQFHEPSHKTLSIWADEALKDLEVKIGKKTIEAAP